jgi:hypothetical protein
VTGAAQVHDPARAPRRREDGYKGDAWSVDVPPDGDRPIVMLDTGVDSVAIVRIPDGAWERGTRPSRVHAHDGYDETILVTRGAGTLLHGPSPDALEETRFEGPVVIQVAPGRYHGIAMDPGVHAIATCFYTVPGTVIEEFSVQMQIIARARVRFDDLPEPHPVPVRAEEYVGPATGVPEIHPDQAASRSRPSAIAGVRISTYPAPNAEGLTLPLDTGHDSLFIMAAAPGPEKLPSGGPATELTPPEEVDVHRHPDVDEFIIRRHGAGWILNGRTPSTVTKTPFRGPCVMVMPAGAFHRIVQREEDEVGDSILIYSHRRAVVERHDRIMQRTTWADVRAAHGEVAR